MKKLSYFFALLIIAPLVFISCNKNTKDLEAQITKLEQMLSTAQSDLTALRTEHNAQTDVKSLEAELQKLSGELAKLRQDYENIGSPTTPTDLTAIENTITDILQRLTDLEGTSPTSTTDITAIETSITDILQRLTDLEGTSPTSTTDITAIENTITDILQRLSDLEGTSPTTTDLSSITDALDALLKDIEKINETIPSSFNQSTIDALIARIDALEKQTEKITPPTKGEENGYEWIDLGLSVKWATCNIGAKENNPKDYGNYYAWGELEGCDKNSNPTDNTNPKTTFNWNTYADSDNGSDSNFKTYYKARMELKNEHDVANVKWGGTWRIPTKKEFQELYDFCITTWIERDGVSGRVFTSLINGQSIFLPAAGRRNDSSLDEAGSYGYYWTRSLSLTSNNYANLINLSSSGVMPGEYSTMRSFGQSVRAVCTPTE